jgi:hypothetical protein
MKKILLVGAIVGFATGFAHAMPGSDAPGRQKADRVDPKRLAQGLGLDDAMARRKPSCIGNDLRPECMAGQAPIGERGQFYVDFNWSTRRCVIVVGRPIVYHVVGGGPFETRSEAKAAIKTIKGCP